MNDASTLKSCPQCGNVIPAEAPQGLCPNCLLGQAATPTKAGSQPAAEAASPTREELAAAFPQLEILELVGHGGMGFVFKARQARLDRMVALKVLPQSLASQPSFAERFAREGRLLARLNHPNIVTIYDFGQANGLFYLLMEYVDGVNLRQAMKAGRFSPNQALAIVPRICEALQFAHTEGVLHRDIKPENILLDGKGRVKIADFGIAKLLGESPAEDALTASGRALGTVHYMAPEQVEKPGQVDHRADIYSLGVVFYEMLTGELPIGRFAPPSESCAVDPRIDEVVFRTLDKKPERRPQSAGEVKTQVETIAAHGTPLAPEEAAPDATWQQERLDYQEVEDEAADSARRRRVRRRSALAAGLGVVLLGTIAVGVLVWKSPRGNALVVVPKNEAAPGKSAAAAPNAPAVPTAIGGEVSTNEAFTRSIVLARPAKQLVGESSNTWTVGFWSDTSLPPGQTLTARVRQDEDPIAETGCSSLCFFQGSPDKAGTSAALSWFFGAIYHRDFGESQAEAALAQVQERVSAGPLSLTAGRPEMVFSVTNESGHVLVGYVELTRYVPKPPKGSWRSAPKPRAILHVRRFAAYLPSFDYAVKLPPGYALRPTVELGSVSTFFPASAAGGDYHTSWYIPQPFRLGAASPSPADYHDHPSQMEAQRKLLEVRFQELQDLGPIPVSLGEPYLIFAITNRAGEVYRSSFELVGPSADDSAAERAAAQAASRKPQPVSSTPRQPQPPLAAARPPAAPRNMLLPGLSPSGRIDPATGLPAGPAAPGSATIDPATGLPLPAAPPTASSRALLRTNHAANPTPH